MLHSKAQSVRSRLLITGANGFVGRHLVACLLRDPAVETVIVCDLQGPAVHVEGPRLQSAALDVREPDACSHVVSNFAPTHIIHAAAVTTGSERELFEANVQGTRNMLAAVAAQNSIERFILLSSSGVYGSPMTDAPCDEEHPLDLRGAYARSKHCAEQATLQAEPLRAIVARIGPCFGAGERPGHYRPNVSLIARLLFALQTGLPLRVAGDDYSRDWTHLEDIHTAIASLLFLSELRHRIYNISAGAAISSRELLRCFEVHGLRVEWTTAAYADLVLRREEARKPLVIDRLRDDTGFRPAMEWQQRIEEVIAASEQR